MSRFQRAPAVRRYRRLFIIATEGEVTEKDYFEGLFGDNEIVLRVECLVTTGGQSAPPYVLERMENYVSKAELRNGDQAWLVVDRDADSWTISQLSELREWCLRRNTKHPTVRHDMGFTNPCFELWLLWHFQDCPPETAKINRDNALAIHLPGYDKSLDQLSLRKLKSQVSRALRFAQHYRQQADHNLATLDFNRGGSSVDALVFALQSCEAE